jgi:hypothetical protein
VSGDNGDGVLQHERATGNEESSMTEGDDGRRWEVIEGSSRRWRWLQF